jgi:hypothetical protein
MSDSGNILPIQNESATYEIRLQGHLAGRWVEWFGAAAIELEEDGTTRLTCAAIDQAALYGLLKRVRDVGLPLVSVNRIGLSQNHPEKEHEE